MACRPSSPSPLSYRTPGDTAEHVVCAKPCWVYGLSPDLTTTGTITLRNAAATGGSAVMQVSAIGLTQAGKAYAGGQGTFFDTGLTVQLSVATDLSLISYEAAI